MSTMSSDEYNWIDKQVTHSTPGTACDHLTERPRLVLAERGAHTGAKMCSTMQELTRTKHATKLGCTGSHLVNSTWRRLLSKSLEQERPRHLLFSLRCGSHCIPSRTVNNLPADAQKQTEREKKRRLQQEYKGALELGTSANWTRRGRPLGMETPLNQANWTDNDGELRNTLGQSHTFLSWRNQHHEAETRYHTFWIPFADALATRIRGVRFHRSCC